MSISGDPLMFGSLDYFPQLKPQLISHELGHYLTYCFAFIASALVSIVSTLKWEKYQA